MVWDFEILRAQITPPKWKCWKTIKMLLPRCKVCLCARLSIGNAYFYRSFGETFGGTKSTNSSDEQSDNPKPLAQHKDNGSLAIIVFMILC